jgi:hypothetical protein
VPLISILTRTDFEDLPHFRDQVSDLQKALKQYPLSLIRDREFAE